MTKRWYDALEKVYTQEIEGALRGWGRAYQSKARVYRELEEAGLVEETTELLRFKNGLPPMEIKGWELTLLGNFSYCMECDEPAE